jgi:hypothetical protein
MINCLNLSRQGCEELIVSGLLGEPLRVIGLRSRFVASTGKPAPESEAVRLTDQFGPRGELLEPGDLVPERVGTVLSIRGEAVGVEAPVSARVQVGTFNWRATVWHPRRWVMQSGQWCAERAGPFQPVKLAFASAFGGPSFPDNPLGMGHIGSGEHPEGIALPLIEQVGLPVHSPWQRLEPVALDYIPPEWPARRRFSGTFDAAWARKQAPRLPDDFDPRFWDAGTLVTYPRLRGGEELLTENIGCLGVARWRVPRNVVRVTIEGRTYLPEVDQLILDVAGDRLTLCSRLSLPVDTPLSRLPLAIARVLEERWQA